MVVVSLVAALRELKHQPGPAFVEVYKARRKEQKAAAAVIGAAAAGQQGQPQQQQQRKGQRKR